MASPRTGQTAPQQQGVEPTAVFEPHPTKPSRVFEPALSVQHQRCRVPGVRDNREYRAHVRPHARAQQLVEQLPADAMPGRPWRYIDGVLDCLPAA
jgi:hypothetical protein